MTSPVDPQILLDEFARMGWESCPYERMLDLVTANPTGAERLLLSALERGGKSPTFLHAALSFVPEHALAHLADKAVAAYELDANNQVAARLIEDLSLQAVSTLQLHLPRLFALLPNSESYTRGFPWRGADEQELGRLLVCLTSEPKLAHRLKAFECIIQSRDGSACAEAMENYPKGLNLSRAEGQLLSAGLDGPERKLYAKACYHIRFPRAYCDALHRAPWRGAANHPTWHLDPLPDEHNFGGTTENICSSCGGPLHNLITLNPVPKNIGVTYSKNLGVSTCLSCVGWEQQVLFLKHDKAGKGNAFPDEQRTPEFPAKPLLEVSVQLSESPQRWLWQDWGLSNSRENLNRIGGHPTWVQSADYPDCPSCCRKMPFLLQLDSGLLTSDGGDWLWGSGGVCYVFWCDECGISASTWQCT